MENDKSPERTFSKKEREIVLGNLLRRIHNDETTQKEKKAIESLKTSYDPAENTETLTNRELRKAVRRNRKRISERIASSRYPGKRNSKKTIRHVPVIIESSAAAIALLILMLTVPLTKDPSHSSTTGIFAESTMIEKQFATGDNMKRIILADGSTVFLNQGTTLSLRQGRFNVHTREVWLDEGEAFFNVAKDPERPFIVHTPNGISTKVLGTSFNIKAYAKLEEQVISVNTGRVQVYDEKDHKIVLDPNYKVSVKNTNSEFITGKTDAKNISAWRSGTIVLEEATIKEVAFRLNQVFDMDLVYEQVGNVDEKIVTSFSLDTPPDEVLERICKLYNVHYKRNNNTIELIK